MEPGHFFGNASRADTETYELPSIDEIDDWEWEPRAVMTVI